MRARAKLWKALPLAGWLAFASLPVAAVTKQIDLDAQTVNGAESKCDLNVLQTFPVMIENVVTNKAVGNAFNFSWPSAGPGGFSSAAAPGTTGGVGARWTWTTNQSVYAYIGTSCANDVCFLKTSGPDSLPGACTLGCGDDGVTLAVARGATAAEVALSWSGGTGTYSVFRSAQPSTVTAAANRLSQTSGSQYVDVPPAGSAFFYRVRGSTCNAPTACNSNAQCTPSGQGICASRGPFAVPGRSLFTDDVTVSSASLTSSLVTFFSPPTELFRITSTAQPGAVQETVLNGATTPLTVTTEAYPPGCCVLPDQLDCDGNCVDYLNDPQNCGACGNVCGDGTCCSNGSCMSLCDEGEIWCNGECRDPQNDSANCGGCGNVCGEGSCCVAGECSAFGCDEASTLCAGECVDLQSDSANCATCGNVCGEGSCCVDGECASTCEEGLSRCGSLCYDLQNDPDNCGACGNACGEGSCCVEGACASTCQDGRTLCGSLCYDLQNDPNNCGACGNVCSSTSICTGGACVPCGTAGGRRDACDNRCVNTRTDPYNCGACGVTCNLDCPANFKNACNNGTSCTCVPGTPAPPLPSNIPPPTDPFCPSSAPPPDPTQPFCPSTDPPPDPTEPFCLNPHPSGPIEGECPPPGPPAPPPPAPVCVVQPDSITIPPGDSVTTCRPGGLLFKEVPAVVRVCGDGIPGPDGECLGGMSKVTTGTSMRFVPDTETPLGDAYLTPFAVHVIEENSKDGLIQPGETVSLLVDLVNAGPLPVGGATATLVAPSVDLSDDAIGNPVAPVILQGTASYETVPGTTPSENCAPVTLHPKRNGTPFRLTIPADLPGDTSLPLRLQLAGTVNGGSFSMDVPFAVGIADRCVYAAATGDFDGLDGLSSPMGTLVPKGETVPTPYPTLNAGSSSPLKVKVLCGTTNLEAGETEPPEIVGISEATRGELDIPSLDLNDSANPDDPLFKWTSNLSGGGPSWRFQMRTANLGIGTFTLTIRIAGRKDYVTIFETR